MKYFSQLHMFLDNFLITLLLCNLNLFLRQRENHRKVSNYKNVWCHPFQKVLIQAFKEDLCLCVSHAVEVGVDTSSTRWHGNNGGKKALELRSSSLYYSNLANSRHFPIKPDTVPLITLFHAHPLPQATIKDSPVNHMNKKEKLTHTLID